MNEQLDKAKGLGSSDAILPNVKSYNKLDQTKDWGLVVQSS